MEKRGPLWGRWGSIATVPRAKEPPRLHLGPVSGVLRRWSLAWWHGLNPHRRAPTGGGGVEWIGSRKEWIGSRKGRSGEVGRED